MLTVFVLGIGLAMIPSDACGQVRIAMRPLVEADSEIVKLGEIAEVSGGDEPTRQRISGLDFAIDHTRDHLQIVDERQAAARLLLAGFNESEFTIQGQAFIQVVNSQKTATQWTVQAIETSIARHVAKSLDLEPVNVETNVINGNQLQISGKLLRESTIEPLDHGDRLVGRKVVAMGVFRGDQMVDQFRIAATTSIRKRVLVAKRPIERGESFSSENTRQVWRTFESSPFALPAPDAALGKKASRRIRSQDVIKVSDLERNQSVRKQPDIKPRDKVVGIASRSGLRVVVSGLEALKSGTRGDTIPLRNPESGKVVYGKVLDPTTVEISF